MLKPFANLFSPSVCVMCNITSNKYYLCEKCQQSLPLNVNPCPTCAEQVKANSVCGQCLKSPPIWQTAKVPFLYQTSIKHLIGELKFHHKPYLAKTLAYYFLKNYQGNLPNTIIPVPLHKKRLSYRKYNQSYLLAKHIAKGLKVSLEHDIAIRFKNTESQTLLDQKQRQRNMKNAFIIKRPQKIIGKHLVVVDDVYTTGSTLTALCKDLARYKPKSIEVWCIARSTS